MSNQIDAHLSRIDAALKRVTPRRPASSSSSSDSATKALQEARAEAERVLQDLRLVRK